MRRLVCVFLFLLASCRLEPGVVLGKQTNGNPNGQRLPNCSSYQLTETQGDSGMKADELSNILSMYETNGILRVILRARGGGHGVPQLVTLHFFRPGPDPGGLNEPLRRNAICKETGRTTSDADYDCSIENKGNTFDNSPFWVEYLVIKDEFQHAFAAGPPNQCLGSFEVSSVSAGYLGLPSVIPSELRAKPSEEEWQ